MSLPSGLLSLASPLGWESEEVPRLGVCCTAWIPKVRIEDFVKGEGERGHTHFVRQHCYENGEVKSALDKVSHSDLDYKLD